MHYLQFKFPYSHSLVAAIFWSCGAFLLAFLFFKTAKIKHGVVMGLAVFSHFLLDFLVHGDMTINGLGSSTIGLNLWDSLYFAHALETLLVLTALVIYPISQKMKAINKIAISLLVLFVLAMTVLGQLFAAKPPAANAAAISWIFLPLVGSGLAAIFDSWMQT